MPLNPILCACVCVRARQSRKQYTQTSSRLLIDHFITFWRCSRCCSDRPYLRVADELQACFHPLGHRPHSHNKLETDFSQQYSCCYHDLCAFGAKTVSAIGLFHSPIAFFSKQFNFLRKFFYGKFLSFDTNIRQ